MKRFQAFTLAEVLITITIVGVVAAITIPSLVKNVQDYAFAKAKENSLLKITEATKEMKSNDVLSGYSSNSDFVDEFQKYMTVVKRCDSTSLDGCFVDKFKTVDGDNVDTSTLTTGKKLGKNNLSDNTIGLMLKNGTTMLLSLKDATKDPAGCARINPYDNTSGTTGCMSFLYDINGRGGPNTLGRDIGTIAVTAFTCTGYKTADGTCFSNAFVPTPLTYAQCMAQKASFGISTCYSSLDSLGGDKWAGAAVACNGSTNLATGDQLAKLANELLGVTGCIPNAYSASCTGNLNYTVAAKIGLPSSGTFQVWSVQNDSSSVFYRSLGLSNNYGGSVSRTSTTTRWAICMGQ